MVRIFGNLPVVPERGFYCDVHSIWWKSACNHPSFVNPPFPLDRKPRKTHLDRQILGVAESPLRREFLPRVSATSEEGEEKEGQFSAVVCCSLHKIKEERARSMPAKCIFFLLMSNQAAGDGGGGGENENC